MRLHRVASRLLAGRLPGGVHRCPLCENSVRRFLPYRHGERAPLMKALGTVGSDVANFECPRCGAHDRERHLLLYMSACGLLTEMRGKAVLHFAPEKRLWRYFAEARPSRYVRCDLYPKTTDVQSADLLDMEFNTGEFDILIANHVLEHVADDLRALSEIVRVVKPGGWVVLQTPFSPKLHCTWKDSGIDDDAARLQAYGQEDHMRLYGRDVFDRIASSGLVPDVRVHEGILSDVDPFVVGVNKDEPLFLFQRR